MTRLDHGAEPSMEDILASIRKIIAEEPPGLRPVPPLQRAMASSTSVIDRPPLHREPLSELRPAAIEPYLRSSPAQSPSQTNMPAYPSASVPLAEVVKPAADRVIASRSVEPEFKASSLPGKSIDDQLADLLGDAPAIAQSAANDSLPDRLPDAAQIDPSIDVVAKLTGWPSPVETTNAAPNSHDLEPRPGFTVSRAGYVHGANATDDQGPDPFEFDLGPSPFELKIQKIIDPALPGDAGGAAETLKEAAETSQPEPKAETPAVEKIEADSAPVQPAPAPMPAREVMREVKFVTPIGVVITDAPRFDPLPIVNKEPALAGAKPSVTATLPPERSEAELDAAFAHSKSRVPPASPAASAAPDRAAPSASARAAAANIEEPAVVTDIHDDEHPAPSSSSQNALTFAEPSQSAIEDSVADLLRPMLKSWLAENMPKIVERALRREFSEQNRTEQKSAAE